MANLVITSTANSIKVVFNDQPFFDKRDGMTFSKGTWAKSEIADIKLNTDDSMVVVQEKDDFEWKVSDSGTSGTLTVDSVDGATPSSLDDLYTKLIALIA